MTNYHCYDWELQELEPYDIPGHHNTAVYCEELNRLTLHCQGCGWSDGRSLRRHHTRRIREAWQAHVDYVQRGGTITHGRADNVDEGICRCVSCEQAHNTREVERDLARAREATR